MLEYLTLAKAAIHEGNRPFAIHALRLALGCANVAKNRRAMSHIMRALNSLRSKGA